MTIGKLILERLLALGLLAFWVVPLYSSHGDPLSPNRDSLSPWTLSFQHPVIWLGLAFPLAFLWATWIRRYRLRLAAILALALFVDVVLTFFDGDRFIFELGTWLLLIVLIFALAATLEDGLNTFSPHELRHAVPFIALSLALAALAPVYMSFQSHQKVRNPVYVALVGPSLPARGSIEPWVAPSPASRAPSADDEPPSQTGGTATMIFAIVGLAIALAATAPIDAQSLHAAIRRRNTTAGKGLDPMTRIDARPLPFWALEHADRNLLVALLDAGLSPDARDQRGSGLLHTAVLLGDQESTTLLLARGADPNLRDSAGCTPQQIAASLGNTTLIELFRAVPVSGGSNAKHP